MIRSRRGRIENDRLRERKPQWKVCVFVDTAVFKGDDILMAMVDVLETPRIYVINQYPEISDVLRGRLREINRKAEIVCVSADSTRLSDIDRACEQIVKAESKIDVICVRTNFYYLSGPFANSKGPELCMDLFYFAPMRFVHNLEPLLKEASRPRVLIIGLHERKESLIKKDLGMEEKWSAWRLGSHVSALTALAFQRFAKRNPTWTLLYSPGTPMLPPSKYLPLNLEPFRPNILPGPGASTRRRILGPPLIGAFVSASLLILPLIAFSPEESGRRYLNLLTSDNVTAGVWRVTPLWQAVSPSEAISEAQKEGWGNKCWDFTTHAWERVLDDDAKHE